MQSLFHRVRGDAIGLYAEKAYEHDDPRASAKAASHFMRTIRNRWIVIIRSFHLLIRMHPTEQAVPTDTTVEQTAILVQG